MSAHPVRHSLRRSFEVRQLGWLAVPLVGVWTVGVVAAKFGLASLAHLDEVILAVPLALLPFILLARQPAIGALRAAAAWSAIVAVGLLAAPVIANKPTYALGVPAIALAAAVCARWPVFTVGALFAMTGAYNSILAFTPIPVYQVSDVFIAGVGVAAIWSLVMGRHYRRVSLSAGTMALGAFVFISALQILVAHDLNIGRDSYHASIWYMIPALALAVGTWRPGVVRRMVQAFIVVCALVGAYATLRWIIGPASAEKALALTNAARFNFVKGHLVDLGSFPTGHHLAAWTGQVIPFCAAGALAFAGRWRAISLLACGLCGAGLLGSEVRAGVAGLFLGLLTVLALVHLSRAYSGPRLGTIGLVLGGLFAMSLVIVSLQGGATRYTNILHPSQDAAFQERLIKWRDALTQISHHPLGQGLGTSGEAQLRFGRFNNEQKFDVDNSYLKIGIDQGIPMISLYLLTVLLLLVGLGRRAIRSEDSVGAGIAIGACGTLVSFLVIIFTGIYTEGLTAAAAWIAVGLGLAHFTARENAPAVPGARANQLGRSPGL